MDHGNAWIQNVLLKKINSLYVSVLPQLIILNTYVYRRNIAGNNCSICGILNKTVIYLFKKMNDSNTLMSYIIISNMLLYIGDSKATLDHPRE